jgi:deoxyribonuclease IV
MPAMALPLLPPLGAHVSVAGGCAKAIGLGEELGCGAIQIFVKNASQWRGKELAEEEVAGFRQAHAGSRVGPLVAHASYLINLAATDPEILRKSREALADEARRCARLGVGGLVLHPGAHLGAGEERGIDLVAESLDAVFAELRTEPPAGPLPRILLENTAGQGSCLGHRLEHLAAIRARVEDSGRVGVCLDTCHAFAAGYAVHEEAGYEDFVAEVGERLGFALVGCFHLNDSLRPFASRRDRHEHIGKGQIGLGLFARLLHDPRLAAIPMVLETEPGDNQKHHRKNLSVLRRLEPDGTLRRRQGRARVPTA